MEHAIQMTNTEHFNSNEMQVIVDVGGSGVQVYRRGIDSTYRLVVDFETTTDRLSMNEWLRRHVINLTADYPRMVLGLPGPVDDEQKEVYCPPLDATIDLTLYRSKGIKIVNDTVAHLLICWNKTMASTRQGSLLTIGTSLGLCTYKVDEHTGFLDMSKVKSHEIAHDKTVNYRSIIHPSIYPAAPTSLGALFSMSALANLFNKATTPVASGLSRVSKEVINTIIPDLVESGKFEQWLKSLNICVNNYLISESLDNCTKEKFISGGLVVAVSREPRLRDAVIQSGLRLLKSD